MHELRRPLQALALIEEPGPAPPALQGRRGLVELACSALTELDAVVNGSGAAPARRRCSGRELVHAALARWRPAAEASGGIRVFWDAGDAALFGDPVRLSRALDNLIANAVEHGGPPLVLTAAVVAGRLRLTVANGVRGGGAAEPADENGASGSAPGGCADPRRGHGTELVSEIAREHRGRFAFCRTGSGCVAALELPLADESLARAA